jgi:hypothetical protein
LIATNTAQLNRAAERTLPTWLRNNKQDHVMRHPSMEALFMLKLYHEPWVRCPHCNGDGHSLLNILCDCPLCLGVGEIISWMASKYRGLLQGSSSRWKQSLEAIAMAVRMMSDE